MSVLETPRILFRGQIAFDPIVTNNDPTFYDEATAEPEPAHGAVAAFRQRAIAAVTDGTGNWNPHGTHRSSFFESEVSGADLGSGVVTADPFVGAPASFLGMLVDAEPYGTFSSQLFFDSMQFGIAGGCRISCPRMSRFIARYINFNRNTSNRMIAGVGSVIWQTSFAKSDGIVIDAHDSPALQALAKAMEAQDVLGLTVRWNAYRTIYFDNPCLRNQTPAAQAAAQTLADKLNAGGFQPNPARSQIVGVIGLWREGEPASEPGDRALLAASPGEVVASAFARLSGQTLTVDLGNSITEVDELLNKQNMGTLDVVAVGPDGKSVLAPLGTLSYPQYDRAAYDRGSGIVTLNLSAQAAKVAGSNDIQIRSGNGEVYLSEAALRAIPGEHNRYTNEGDPALPLCVQVYYRGVPAMGGVDVTLYKGPPSLASPPPPLVPLETKSTDGLGRVDFDIAPIAGGAVQSYVLGPGPDVPVQLDPQLTTYFYVRTLPADDAVAALEPSWTNVYNYVLANWKAMAPCMDNWLDLADPDQVRAYAPVLKRLTDPGYFEAYRYMPVVRDMTAGERTLLYAFLDSPRDGEAAADKTALKAEAPAQPKVRDLAALSRAFRSH